MNSDTTFKKALLTIFFILWVFTCNSQKIIGYATSWSGKAADIPYSCLTHINYAFALPSADGHLRPLENISKLQSLVSVSHNSGVKVLISVGGWSDENGPLDAVFETIGNNPVYRINLINDIISLISTYSLDGADIDWEYPDAGSSAANYDSLMTRLYQSLHPNGKLVTTAVAGNSWGGAGIDPYIMNVVDWINIMGYDYNSYQHSTFSESIAGVEYYREKGFPDSLMALGVPFYGRDSWESYADLVGRGANPYQDTFQGIGYNGINTIKQKADYVKTNGLAGIMIWELSQDLNDQYSLVSCICNEFSSISNTNAYTSPDIKVYPNPSRDRIHILSGKEISDVQIYDSQGRLVYSNIIDAIDTTVDLSGLSPGIFFLYLNIDKIICRYKILKM